MVNDGNYLDIRKKHIKSPTEQGGRIQVVFVDDELQEGHEKLVLVHLELLEEKQEQVLHALQIHRVFLRHFVRQQQTTNIGTKWKLSNLVCVCCLV